MSRKTFMTLLSIVWVPICLALLAAFRALQLGNGVAWGLFVGLLSLVIVADAWSRPLPGPRLAAYSWIYIGGALLAPVVIFLVGQQEQFGLQDRIELVVIGTAIAWLSIAASWRVWTRRVAAYRPTRL